MPRHSQNHSRILRAPGLEIILGKEIAFKEIESFLPEQKKRRKERKKIF